MLQLSQVSLLPHVTHVTHVRQETSFLNSSDFSEGRLPALNYFSSPWAATQFAPAAAIVQIGAATGCGPANPAHPGLTVTRGNSELIQK